MVLATLLALLVGCSDVAMAQVATTTVQDTVYSADGTFASGTVLVSWGAFTTAAGQAVPAGSTSATIGANGVLTMSLAPNAGSTPMGSYYTAVFHLSDGTTSREYWVVPVAPVGGGPAKLAAIQSQVLPTNVAMQTVSKQYVDQAIAQAQFGSANPLLTGPGYVLITGDTMTGPLVLPGDPVSPLQAADKNYVDENIAATSAGLGQKVSELPTGTQVVSQPSGTQLEVNNLNGDLYASQYVTGGGNNGISNALSSPDCANGCKLIVEPTYTGSDPLHLATPKPTVVVDQRGGTSTTTDMNPLPNGQTYSTTQTITQYNTLTSPQLETLRPGALATVAAPLTVTEQAMTGGSNINSGDAAGVPYGKSTYGTMAMTGQYNTQGQHIQVKNTVNCYAVGDCLAGSQSIVSEGGYRDSGDEGAHPYDLQINEDYSTFGGLCAGGCTTGSTQLAINATVGQGTQGDGRFLIDTNPAKDISTGTLTGGGKTIFGTAAFTGTNFPVSVFLSTAQAAPSQPTNMAPGTVTLPIATTGVTSGFATSTAALPASSGVACVADVETGTIFPNYEMANYTVVDSTHLQLTLNKPHGTGATVAVGGLCGYGLEQSVDTIGLVMQVFPVIGSIDATDLYYADALTPVIGGYKGLSNTGGYINQSIQIASVSRSGNVVTLTSPQNFEDLTGLTLTVSGVADSSYNGSYVVTSIGPNSVTFANTGPNSTSSGGTMSIITGGYVLYPMAEVLSVLNPTDEYIDGWFTLAPNTVPWATGDSVESPHYYQQQTFADMEFVSQYVPRPVQYIQAGKQYGGNVGPGVRGWQITNAVAASNYLGAGGTHNVPDDAYVVNGPWRNDFELDAGTNTVLYLHCNLHGCNRWDSAYDLFLLDSAAGEDILNYSPSSSTVTWSMRGTNYSFSPTAFTAGTINVGTLNATTITGGISGSAINSGKISAAQLPLFGPSGTTHAPGIVPDPGSTAGSIRYLREDGTWSVPAGGSGGSPTGAAGGDLSGSYPNPTVSAVHATSGTLNGVTIGASTPGPGSFTYFYAGSGQNTQIAPSASGGGYSNFTMNGNNADTTRLGFIGGGTGDPNLYLDVPSGGFFCLRIGSASCNGGEISSTGINVTGNLTGGTVTDGVASLHAGVLTGATTGTFSGAVTAASYIGPATAPSGSCTHSGAWVFSQDGHATFCASGTWATKI